MRSLKRRVKPLMRRLRARRGVALFISLFFVGAIGALALSAIYLTMNAQLLSRSYEKEDNLKYAAEAALAVGKAELNFNPAALPSTSYVSMMSNKQLVAGDGQTIPGVTVDLYVGQTGSRTGQFGRFASLLALAHDASGTGFARRLELTQESFAKYAYWTNSEGAGISFGGGDQLWGPVWSNDTINILSSGATFHDEVGTAGIITGVANGTFVKGYSVKQKSISLPSLSTLSTLSALASAGGMNIPAPTTGDQTTVRERIEFIAVNLNGTSDSTDANDGFYRIYQANSGQVNWLRANWPGSGSSAKSTQYNCGDWHAIPVGGGVTALEFFPIAVHDTNGAKTWFDTLTASGMAGGATPANISAAHTEGTSSISTIMQNAGARCYLGGDPHLVAVARQGVAGYTTAQIHIGGTDQTFTPTDRFGKWIVNPTPANPLFTTKRPWDAQYLYPLYRGYNTSTKGVMYVAGTVGISGVLRGDITLYSPNTVVILDDLRYSSDPAKGVCLDILGIIAGANVVVADNSLNTPQNIASSGTTYRSLDDTPDVYIQSVIMALGNSFTVENYNGGPTSGDNCSPSTNGRGCLYLTGGLIQQTRGAVGTSSGSGFVKRYSYDPCGVQNPPPYFPTTGRFQDNRYYELDPVKLNVANFFASLSPDK